MVRTYLFLIFGPDSDLVYTRQDHSISVANPLLTSLFESMNALQTVIFSDQFKKRGQEIQHLSMQGGDITINVAKRIFKGYSFFLVYSGSQKTAGKLLENLMTHLRGQLLIDRITNYKFNLPTALKEELDTITDYYLANKSYMSYMDGHEASLEV